MRAEAIRAADRWQALVGARFEGLRSHRGETHLAFSTPAGPRTAVVARTRSLRGGGVPGVVASVVPIFTDDAALLRIELGAGDAVEVSGGGAWLA